MGLEDQGRIREIAERHPEGDLAVVLGSPDPDSAELYAETVVNGDPAFAGALAGRALRLPVFFIAEPEMKAQVPPDVYEEQVSLMEMALPSEVICERVRGVRERAGLGSVPRPRK